MQPIETGFATISKGLGFLQRQPRDWKVTATRTSISRFLHQMILPYISVYTVALGATGTQLGVVNSVGMVAAGLLGPLTGWFIDRTGTKMIYLVSISLLAISYLIYGVAQSWIIIIIAMLLYQMGFSTSVHSCSAICGNSLANEDRATAMSCCESLAAGLLGMLGPMLGAFFVATFGGVNISGIRPLFFVSLAGTIATFLFILTQLSNRQWVTPGKARLNLFQGISQVFREGHNLKRWLVISSITWMPYGMIIPFTQVFAHEVKGAEEYILGAMVTGFALTPLLLGLPLGRLADRIGRKKVLFLIAPIFWASNLILIWAPSPAFLVVAGVLQGCWFINGITTNAMTFELVPREQMGRWTGVVRLFRMLLAGGTAYMAGVIWDNIGPQWVFLGCVAIDALIRIPLLIGMHETLDRRPGTEQ